MVNGIPYGKSGYARSATLYDIEVEKYINNQKIYSPIDHRDWSLISEHHDKWWWR